MTKEFCARHAYRLFISAFADGAWNHVKHAYTPITMQCYRYYSNMRLAERDAERIVAGGARTIEMWNGKKWLVVL